MNEQAQMEKEDVDEEKRFKNALTISRAVEEKRKVQIARQESLMQAQLEEDRQRELLKQKQREEQLMMRRQELRQRMREKMLQKHSDQAFDDQEAKLRIKQYILQQRLKSEQQRLLQEKLALQELDKLKSSVEHKQARPWQCCSANLGKSNRKSVLQKDVVQRQTKSVATFAFLPKLLPQDRFSKPQNSTQKLNKKEAVATNADTVSSTKHNQGAKVVTDAADCQKDNSAKSRKNRQSACVARQSTVKQIPSKVNQITANTNDVKLRTKMASLSNNQMVRQVDASVTKASSQDIKGKPAQLSTQSSVSKADATKKTLKTVAKPDAAVIAGGQHFKSFQRGKSFTETQKTAQVRQTAKHNEKKELKVVYKQPQAQNYNIKPIIKKHKREESRKPIGISAAAQSKHDLAMEKLQSAVDTSYTETCVTEVPQQQKTQHVRVQEQQNVVQPPMRTSLQIGYSPADSVNILRKIRDKRAGSAKGRRRRVAQRKRSASQLERREANKYLIARKYDPHANSLLADEKFQKARQLNEILRLKREEESKKRQMQEQQLQQQELEQHIQQLKQQDEEKLRKRIEHLQKLHERQAKREEIERRIKASGVLGVVRNSLRQLQRDEPFSEHNNDPSEQQCDRSLEHSSQLM